MLIIGVLYGWVLKPNNQVKYRKIQKNKDINLMNNEPSNNPMHGMTLEKIINYLEQYYGWEELGNRINIGCFNNNPSVKSSLKFLRKTPWAREKVEKLYRKTIIQ
jgi:uncharacterized protein (DUF2132 family)